MQFVQYIPLTTENLTFFSCEQRLQCWKYCTRTCTFITSIRLETCSHIQLGGFCHYVPAWDRKQQHWPSKTWGLRWVCWWMFFEYLINKCLYCSTLMLWIQRSEQDDPLLLYAGVAWLGLTFETPTIVSVKAFLRLWTVSSFPSKSRKDLAGLPTRLLASPDLTLFWISH